MVANKRRTTGGKHSQHTRYSMCEWQLHPGSSPCAGRVDWTFDKTFSTRRCGSVRFAPGGACHRKVRHCRRLPTARKFVQAPIIHSEFRRRSLSLVPRRFGSSACIDVLPHGLPPVHPAYACSWTPRCTMSSPSASDPPSPPVVLESPSGGLHIPEGKDGFFGYSDERTHQQVRTG